MDISTLPVDRIPEVITLWEAAGLTRPWNDPRSDALMALEYDGSTVLIGTDEDDTIITSAMAGFDGHLGWVYYVAVVPTLQGSGLGQEVMDAAESWLVGQGVHKIKLQVRTDNTKVIGFDERLGFETEDFVVMAKHHPPAGADA